ncbi:C-type lectin 37Db-like [Drosophila albomicans]|uniref:C-type lectin 37Db-like n=1 Tax=Drosophila albomicans TaxID=7291 RepID=A0A6P8Y2T9_DROAB|nr:C-type lectin 37Db-like [Drosophila albomicans]
MDSKVLSSFLFFSVIVRVVINAEPFQQMRVVLENGMSNDFHGDIAPFKKILEKYYYIERNIKVDWYTALHKCRELGGNLVNFQSDKEYDAVLRELNVREFYWIDLNDLGEQLKFHSMTTGLPISFNRWGSVEPNNMGTNERCVQLRKNQSETLIMNDIQCDRLCSFICQTKLPLQTNFVVWLN